MKRLLTKSDVGLESPQKPHDGIIPQDTMEEVSKNRALLDIVARDWMQLRDFRNRRKRNRKYLRGDQWSDVMTGADGVPIIEEDFIVSQGKVPLKQNLIRQIQRNILGQFRTNKLQSIAVSRTREKQAVGEMMTNALHYAQLINESDELDVRNLEEFLLSGSAIFKQSYKEWKERNRPDIRFDICNVNRMFFNTDVSDVRTHDLRRIGEIIDTDIETVVSSFAVTKADEQRIRSYYAGVPQEEDIVASRGLSSANIDSLNFYVAPSGKCRIYEIWRVTSEWRVYVHDPLEGSYVYYEDTKDTRKYIEYTNQSRLTKYMQAGYSEEDVPFLETTNKRDEYWEVLYLTPEGNTLFRSETPFEHGEHPYTVLLYPLLDGEVWGLIEDFIDQQKYVNRLISLQDFIIGASAKGVLMIPEDAIPAGKSPEDFAEDWRTYNGVVVYKPSKSGAKPEQVHANSQNIGIYELLSMEMSLMKEVSGISGAIQGHDAKSGTPSSLYAQMAQNSMLSIQDIFDTYHNFLRKRDTKAVKLIKQFYTEERYLNVSGKMYSEQAKIYTPEDVDGIDFDLIMSKIQDTPVLRQIVDDKLEQFTLQGMMPFEMYLEHSSLPMADALLQEIRTIKEQQSQEQIQGQANPEAMALLDQAVANPKNAVA